ncbi:MAG TPA: apolipoprotein N-acyltransferase [Balneolaceae bacterium]|nr:apolipoprotein N-acyltransferase [Balneolaceae bacterium]|tara:strand:+ start:89976 stop:91535 length:1560 start_codon:yes stop_codon:yes gene_type:complete
MMNFFQNKWILSLTAGLFLALSFPPIDLSFLSIPAFILLFHLSAQCHSYRQLAYFSYPGFVLWNLLTTYWLMMASLAAGIAAILANAVLMTIPLVLMRFFQRRFTHPLHIAVLQTSTWVLYEYLHHHWDLAWPWLAIGNAWANQISLIQYISITGHLGITFWVVFTAALAYQSLINNKRTYAYITLAYFLLVPLGSLIYFAIDDPYVERAETINVTVAQPNHDSYEDYGGMSGPTEVLDSLFAVTAQSKPAHTDLVVWPENAIDKPIRMFSRTANRIADSARTWNTGFVVGTGLFTVYEDSLPRLYRGGEQSKPFNIFNSALYVDGNGEKSRYDKHNLVPFVERIPFVNVISRLDVIGLADWRYLAGYGKGYTPDMLETDKFKTSGLVCYDSVFPSWNREFVVNGADFITIITNDGWWGNSSGHKQHFAYAKLRAIEFDRWVVRSANNGTSGIIRPDGSVEQYTDYWVRTGFNTNIPLLKTSTIYTRFGDWLSILCFFSVLVGLGFGLTKQRNHSISNE